MLGFKQTVSYYCNDEKTWIFELVDDNNLPTTCKNNNQHTINKVFVNNRCCNAKQMKANRVFDEVDLTSVNNANVVQKLLDLSRRVKLLEDILEKNGLLKFIN